MNEEIVGIDRRPDGSRPHWWQIGLGILLAAGAAAWLVDAVVETSTEGAAETLAEFFDALADGDGERMCALITDEAGADVVAVGALSSAGVEPTCEEAMEAEAESLLALGGSLDRLDDPDPEQLEDAIEIDGDRATATAATGLTESSIDLRRVDGRWLVDLSTSEAAPSGELPPNGSEQELIEAADMLCVAAFGRSSTALAAWIQGLEDVDPAAALRGLGDLEDSEAALLADLRRLNRGHESPALAALIAALRREVEAIDELSRSPAALDIPGPDARSARRGFLRASSRVIAVAKRNGFAAFGCAAPPSRSAGGSIP